MPSAAPTREARTRIWRFASDSMEHALVYVPPGPRGEASQFVLDGAVQALQWRRVARGRRGRLDVAELLVDGQRIAVYRTIDAPSERSRLAGILGPLFVLWGGETNTDAIYASRGMADPLMVDFRVEVDGRRVHESPEGR